MTAPSTSIDESVLDGYRELQEPGEKDIVTEFIDVFLEDLPGRITQIRTATAERAAPAIKAAAHALKGSAGSIGAVTLASLCGELELDAKDGKTDSGPELVAQIESEGIRVIDALNRLRK